MSRKGLPEIFRGIRQFGLSASIVVIILIIMTIVGTIHPSAWPWLAPVAILVATLAPWIVSQVAASNKQHDEIAQVTRQKLRGIPIDTDTELPTAANISLDELGVHRAVLTVPYIHRDQESRIRKLLADGRPVLLVGSSMVGKTMTAATVIKEMYGDKKIVAPDKKDALTSLDSVGVPLDEAVIWLDDINFFIGADGITGNVLRRLAAGGSTVIATIRANAYNRYMPASDIQSPEWDALKIFERVFLNRELSAEEQERITNALDDETVKARISNVGLGEYVGAAEQIEENLRLGPSVNPIGYAVVRGAADWRRAGVDRPVPGTLLPSLASPYLDKRKQFEIGNPDTYKQALTWATHEINEEVSLLQQMDQDSYAVFDYALDVLLGRSEDLPSETWAVVIDAATSSELLSVGYTAWVNNSLFQTAFKAWGKASESDDPQVAPKAIYNIARMLQYERRLDEAKVMYERAINSIDPAIAAVALTDLGYMKFEEGQIDEAKEIYARVLDEVKNPWAIELTHLRLGILSEMQNQYREAIKWYDLASRSGFYDLVPRAEIGLAHVELRQGYVQSARSHYSKAINSGHLSHAPVAAFELANLLIRFDQVEEACNMLRIGVEIWNDQVSPLAAGLLGQLLEYNGQIDAARMAYDTAIKSGHAEALPTASLLLGKLLEERGDLVNALTFYRKATECSVSQIADEAMVHFNRLVSNLSVNRIDPRNLLVWHGGQASGLYVYPCTRRTPPKHWPYKPRACVCGRCVPHFRPGLPGCLRVRTRSAPLPCS